MRNVKLVLEYDGTNYHGWQIQPNVPTIQGVLEKTLAKLTKTAIQVIGAGRTDSGVHAEGQVANFHTDSRIPIAAFQKGLNAILPRDIVVCSATEMPSAFHARFSATSRHYRYTLLNRAYPSALLRQRNYFFPREIDISHANSLCRTLIGKHDFSSFQKVGSNRLSPVCEVYTAYWWRQESHVHFEIEADAFLRGMVRAITGTLLKCLGGQHADRELRRILAAKDRAAAGMSVPAHGLSLIGVEYSNTADLTT